MQPMGDQSNQAGPASPVVKKILLKRTISTNCGVMASGIQGISKFIEKLTKERDEWENITTEDWDVP